MSGSAAERFRYEYGEDELAELAERVAEIAGEVRELHVLANNCYRDFAVRNAARLGELLAAAPPTRMSSPEHRRACTLAVKEGMVGLDDWQQRRLGVLAELQRIYADAVLGGNEVEAERIVRDAIEAGVPEAVIDDEIIAPALRLVGDLWATGDLRVEDESRATEISIRVIALQREAFRAAARRASHRILLAGAEGEQHVVGLDMAGSVLVHAGYDVRLLGPDVATPRLVDAVAELRPAILGLTVTMPESAARVPQTIAAVRQADPALGIVVGGQAGSQRMCSTPGVVLCQHVTDALEITDALLHRASLN